MSKQDSVEHDLYLALKKLVELKDMKDELVGEETIENTVCRAKMRSEYERGKPLAWEAARAAIRAYEGGNI